MEELLNDVQRCISKLDDPNKVERKRNVEKIKALIDDKFPDSTRTLDLDQEQLLALWQDRLCRPLLRCVGSDPSERVREISGEVILKMLNLVPNFESSPASGDFVKMDYLFPLLQSRLVRSSLKLTS